MAAAAERGSSLELATAPVEVPWRQDGPVLGLADTSAWQWLGLELLATPDPRVQPVRWFGEIYQLSTRQDGPYRYVDVAPLLARAGGRLESSRDRAATLSLPTAQIVRVRLGRQDWGWRAVFELDRPTLWQQRVTRQEATLGLSAVLTPAAQADLARLATGAAAADPETNAALPTLTATPGAEGLEVALGLPAGLRLQVTTLAEPPRLVLDLRADAAAERDIQWRPGLLWRQRYVALESGDRFALSWLEIDRERAAALRPFWAGEDWAGEDASQLPGIKPLRTMARQRMLAVAANGGYFNRNNQFPLGALRRDARWQSSPILNRGTVAWGKGGGFWFGRGRFFEVFALASRRWPSIFFNSGYVQPGLARYDAGWGKTYSPASDGETIVTVVGDRIARRATGSSAVAIPRNGYLLIARDAPEVAPDLAVGARVDLERGTIPAELDTFPHSLGAGPLLLQAGRVVLDAAAENFSPAFARQAAPRSVLARDARGNLLLVAIGNRIGSETSSRGPTLAEAAQLLQRLGATDALNLDGGSSASLYLGGELVNRPPATAARVHNGLGF